MSPIKGKISNLFSKNKKNDAVSSNETHDDPLIEEETGDETFIENESESKAHENHEADFENENVEQEDSEADQEWESRLLCSDGNCIGVIGTDGRCKECGKPYDENEETYQYENKEEEIPDAHLSEENMISDEKNFYPEDPEMLNINTDEIETETASESESESDWDKRILCSDGNCIGVIGPDGRCKECGKHYED